jgi:hypothetical protein
VKVRSISQVNNSKGIVSILNATEDAVETRDMKVSSRCGADHIGCKLQTVTFLILIRMWYLTKDKLGNSSEETTVK